MFVSFFYNARLQKKVSKLEITKIIKKRYSGIIFSRLFYFVAIIE